MACLGPVKKQSRTHVLIIPSEHFVTRRRPLAGIFQKHQADTLDGAGHRVGVIAPGVVSLRFLLRSYPYPEFETTEGYPVFRRYVRKVLPERYRRPESKIPLYQSIGESLYRFYVARFGAPDLIHAHNLRYAGFVAQAISEHTSIPYVITEHSSQFLREADAPLSPDRLADCMKGASAVTAVSQALANAITSKLLVNDIQILPNVVDPFIMESPLEDRPDRESGTVFLSIGGLDSNKNHASLIEAFAERFRERRATLRIAGTGPLEGALKELAGRLDVMGQVSFLGHLDRPSILEELRSTDAVVLSSLHETFGVVLIEALACGRPVIATRCGGPEDFVTEDCGLLVEPGDAHELGEAMEEMVRTKDKYRPESLRQYCRVRFGQEAFVANVDRVYGVALGTSNGRD